MRKSSESVAIKYKNYYEAHSNEPVLTRVADAPSRIEHATTDANRKKFQILKKKKRLHYA